MRHCDVPDAAADRADADRAARAAWKVGPLAVAEPGADGWGTATATLDGDDVTFSTFGVRPADRPEALLTFAGPIALAADADLVASGPVDPTWRTGLAAALSMMAPWVGATGVPVVDGVTEEVRPATATGRRALCFTGGVDSLWSLLRGEHGITDLLHVYGYEVTLGGEAVAPHVAMLNTVAAETGTRALLVSTRARLHRHARFDLWGYHHGAALAAAGILLSDEVDALVISPSYPAATLPTWGSRPDLDPLWSIPDVLSVEHGRAALARIDRIFEIADEPLVHDTLAVCWERRHAGPALNCGRCEKCIRTMLALESAGVLGRCRTFPPADLPALIRGLAPLPRAEWGVWTRCLDERVAPHLRAAVTDLLAASGADAWEGIG